MRQFYLPATQSLVAILLAYGTKYLVMYDVTGVVSRFLVQPSFEEGEMSGLFTRGFFMP